MKISKWFNILSNNRLHKQKKMKETLIRFLAKECRLQVVSFHNRIVCKALINMGSELSSSVALDISSPRQPVVNIDLSTMEFITSCPHTYVFKVPCFILTYFYSAFTCYVQFLCIKRMKLN